MAEAEPLQAQPSNHLRDKLTGKKTRRAFEELLSVSECFQEQIVRIVMKAIITFIAKGPIYNPGWIKELFKGVRICDARE